MINDTVEKFWSGDTALPYPAVNGEPLRVAAIHTHTALGTLVQLPKECGDFGRDSERLQDVPEGPMVHSVKGRFKVNEGNVKVPVLPELPGLFYYKPESRDVVDGGTIGHKAGLL